MTVLLKVLGCIQGLFEVQWVSESYVSSVILYVSDLTNESPASLSARLRLELSIPAKCTVSEWCDATLQGNTNWKHPPLWLLFSRRWVFSRGSKLCSATNRCLFSRPYLGITNWFKWDYALNHQGIWNWQYAMETVCKWSIRLFDKPLRRNWRSLMPLILSRSPVFEFTYIILYFCPHVNCDLRIVSSKTLILTRPYRSGWSQQKQLQVPDGCFLRMAASWKTQGHWMWTTYNRHHPTTSGHDGCLQN